MVYQGDGKKNKEGMVVLRNAFWVGVLIVLFRLGGRFDFSLDSYDTGTPEENTILWLEVGARERWGRMDDAFKMGCDLILSFLVRCIDLTDSFCPNTLTRCVSSTSLYDLHSSAHLQL